MDWGIVWTSGRVRLELNPKLRNLRGAAGGALLLTGEEQTKVAYQFTSSFSPGILASPLHYLMAFTKQEGVN